MNTNKEIRKLARSDYWQSVFNTSKEGHSIRLFKNITDLSGIQMQFLQWLKIYDMLFTELAQRESYLLTSKVILDDQRCDAYLHVRRVRIENEWKQHQLDKKTSDAKSKHNFKNNDNVSVIDVQLNEGGTDGRRD